jgi:hypothetical protein
MADIRLGALALALILATPVSAGTVDDPEITDPNNDSTGPIAAQDVVKFWIADEIGDLDGVPVLDLNVQTAGDHQHVPGFFAMAITYRISFVPEGWTAGAEAYVTIRANLDTGTASPGKEIVSCRFGVAPAAGGWQDIAGETVLTGVLVAGNHFQCRLPVELLAGYTAKDPIRNLLVQQQLVQRSPLNSGDVAGVTVVRTFDRAPDEGFGRDWPNQPVAPPEEEETPEANSTEETESSSTTTSAPTPTTQPTVKPTNATVEENKTDEEAPPVEAQEDAKSTPLALWASAFALLAVALARRRKD